MLISSEDSRHCFSADSRCHFGNPHVRSGSQTSVEIGAVELHPGNAGVEDIERADQIVIDLDPGDGVEWAGVVETALRMRDLMKAEGFKPWPKLTGGKGIHVMAPLEDPVPHDEAHLMARDLVSELAARFPDRYILSAQANRRGRIFLDYLRNGRGTTAIGAYSPRARRIPDRRARHLGPRRSRNPSRCVYDKESVPAAEMRRVFHNRCNWSCEPDAAAFIASPAALYCWLNTRLNTHHVASFNCGLR
jgi:hypothetical protein